MEWTVCIGLARSAGGRGLQIFRTCPLRQPWNVGRCRQAWKGGGKASLRNRLAPAGGTCFVAGMCSPSFGFLGLLTAAGLCVLGAEGLSAADAPFSISYAGKTAVFTAAELAALGHQDVKAYDFHEKKDHVYTGIPARDLLAGAGIEFGEKLRGKYLRLVVIAHCRDHYDIVYALAEFDDAFNGRTILLVDRQDGQPLPAGMGPVRLLVPGDKRPARWARMVESLEVVSVGEGPKA